jgi:hypothetical protein
LNQDETRRFTDREVALVLRKASDLEEKEGAGAATGLSLRQLEEIAAEVGILPTLVRRAVADMDAGGARPLLSGGPLVRQAIRAVPRELSREAMARMMQHVEGASDQVGVVTEALGATQWTAKDRFRTTQVSITPSEGETRVRVVEHATARLRRVVHLVPTMTALALVGGAAGSLEPGAGVLAGLLALGAAVGGTVGRLIWGRVSAASADRVERLAVELSREAQDGGRVEDSMGSSDTG